MNRLMNVLFLFLGLPILTFFFLFFWVWGVFRPRECGEFLEDVRDPQFTGLFDKNYKEINR